MIEQKAVLKWWIIGWMDNVVSSNEEQSTAQITPQLQHRIRGALNAAGYESIGRKFTSGDYKGMTIFTRIARPQ